ncbi:MAG: NAD(P)H-dependent oxidoreductase [Balneolaceae bacterium]|nr:NAD(P)H-dependent oxidoreductase [Balneolaceae bacterium]
MIKTIKYVCIFLILFFSAKVYAQEKILIVYHSETGHTEQMANAVAEGASGVDGVVVILKSVDKVDSSDLMDATAIIVGSPVHNANVSPEISAFIASWPFEGEPLKDKIGAAFVTAGGISAGEEIVQMNILQSMLVFGMIVVGGPDWTQPFGASAITGEKPFQLNGVNEVDSRFLEKGRALGERVARISKKIQG